MTSLPTSLIYVSDAMPRDKKAYVLSVYPITLLTVFSRSTLIRFSPAMSVRSSRVPIGTRDVAAALKVLDAVASSGETFASGTYNLAFTITGMLFQSRKSSARRFSLSCGSLAHPRSPKLS
jgi:hypothetical protein